METRTLDFHGIALHIRPDDKHGWTLSTEEVAAGYGVSEQAIRMTKSRHKDEIRAGEHFSTITICDAREKDDLTALRDHAIAHPNRHWNKPNQDQTSKRTSNLQRQVTVWTQRGVIRLGMFLTGDRAKLFRDWCEDLAMDVIESDATPQFQVPTTFAEALRLAANQAEQIERMAAENAQLAPKAEALDAIANAEGLHTMQEAANILGIGRTRLFRELRSRRILQHNNQPTRHHILVGRFRVREHTIRKGAQDTLYAQTYVTGKGLTWLHETLFGAGGPQDSLRLDDVDQPVLPN
jgi:phage antirepressor YoqD-like protein